MFKRMEQLFNQWHARTLTIGTLVAAAILVAAPSLARVSQSAPAAPCTTPHTTLQVKIIPGIPGTGSTPGTPPMIDQFKPITVDPTTDEVSWSCPTCGLQHWVVIFNQTDASPFGDYIYDEKFPNTGCPVNPPATDRTFSYIVYVGNQNLDPQVIIKGTGPITRPAPKDDRRKKEKDPQ